MLEAIDKKRRIRWFGHVQRMKDSKKAKQILRSIHEEKKEIKILRTSLEELQSGA